ncbi:MAG: hypothetical protein K6F09_08685, partial [Clostridiales bacterium]|nr:hypothetical protein [Clostridiales bacterium]
MKRYDFTDLFVCCHGSDAEKAAMLFSEEIERRTGTRPEIKDDMSAGVCVSLIEDKTIDNKDVFVLSLSENGLAVTAQGIRGLIFGYSMFLRKSVFNGKTISLLCDISGKYVPDKKIRGHQLGYRPLNNTYEAWDIDDFKRYYLDLMMFGCNMIELIPQNTEGEKNSLMKYSSEELCVLASSLADEFDLDVSLWCPNDDLDIEKSTETRRELFKKCPRIDVLFIPGGDPGEYPADEFFDRVLSIARALRESKPDAQVWPSAQKPHSQKTWGEGFIRRMNELPDEITGVITGPNRAYPIGELRRLLPEKYPIRYYPDITHNLRCEIPVHFDRNDWHYAFAAALGRESVNPRPTEYRRLQRIVRPYCVGSVTYSEGVNDDLNKIVWADADFNALVPVRETLLDYARAYMCFLPAEKIVDGIMGLEYNWYGAPEDDPCIETTLALFEEIRKKYPSS